MSRLFFSALIAAGALSGSAGLSSVSAMPVDAQPASASVKLSSGIEKTAWVCGPYRCFWRPDYGVYGGYVYGGGYGGGWGHRGHSGDEQGYRYEDEGRRRHNGREEGGDNWRRHHDHDEGRDNRAYGDQDDRED